MVNNCGARREKTEGKNTLTEKPSDAMSRIIVNKYLSRLSRPIRSAYRLRESQSCCHGDCSINYLWRKLFTDASDNCSELITYSLNDWSTTRSAMSPMQGQPWTRQVIERYLSRLSSLSSSNTRITDNIYFSIIRRSKRNRKHSTTAHRRNIKPLKRYRRRKLISCARACYTPGAGFYRAKIKRRFPRFIREPECCYALPICRRVHAWRGRLAGRGRDQEGEKRARERTMIRHGGGAYACENTYTTTSGCGYPSPL